MDTTVTTPRWWTSLFGEFRRADEHPENPKSPGPVLSDWSPIILSVVLRRAKHRTAFSAQIIQFTREVQERRWFGIPGNTGAKITDRLPYRFRTTEESSIESFRSMPNDAK